MKGKNKMKRTLSLILAAVMTSVSVCLSSCNKKISFDTAIELISEIELKKELDCEVLLTVEGVPVSAAAVRYANLAVRQYGGITDNADEETLAAINKEVDDFYRLESAIILLNRKYNLFLTEEEFQTEIVDYIKSGREMHANQYEIILDEYMFQTPYFYAENTVHNYGYGMLYEHLYGVDGVSEKKSEVYSQTLAQLQQNDYIRAKHILVSFPEDIEKDAEGNVVESAKAETLAKANEVLEKVKAGKNFDKLIKKYGEDPGMEAYPHGYYFTKGEMVPAFEESAYSLEIGETSGLVETPYGYHIILKLDMDDDALYTTDMYMENAYNALRNFLVEISADYKIEYADNYQTRVDQMVAEYAARVKAEAQAQAELQAQAEAQAKAEATGK